MKDVAELFVTLQTSFHEALVRINAAARGIALVVDADCRLIAVITDGDARRAILAGVPLQAPVSAVLERRPPAPPITAPQSSTAADVIALVKRTGVSHVPLIDESARVVGLVGLDDLLSDEARPLQAIVMAGGLGKRLHPLTASTPKPMLPVGDRPLMEHTIVQLSSAGIRQVHIATHYLSEQISEHFGNGERFGLDVRYVPEEKLLGTVGAVGLMPTSDAPMLVVNGDILTSLDFRAMVSFHREHRADLTVAVRHHEVQVPYGVVETDGVNMVGVTEKPVHRHLVNAGVYLLESTVRQYIPTGERCDMTDLIQVLIREGRTVICFPVWEYWRDIGHSDEYEQAQQDVKNGRLQSL